jgi:hypothetical protein
MNIAIAIHSQEQMSADTAFDVIRTIAIGILKGGAIWLINPQRARKEIAKREAVGIAQKSKAEKILFVRDGVRFHPEILDRFIEAKKEIVGCTTKFRQNIIGTDLTMVDMKVFDVLPKPWFRPDFIKGTNHYTDDDIIFLKSAAEKGFGIYCDERLSESNKQIESEKHMMGVNEFKVNAARIEGGNKAGPVIAVMIPSQDLVYTHSAFDVALMVANSIHHAKAIVLINVQGDRIEYQRNIGVDIAQQEKADHILMIDSDMKLPPHSLRTLMSRKKEVIGVNASKRDGTNVPVLRKNAFGKLFNYKRGKPEQVSLIGMAVTLIDMKVFDKLEKPYFYANFEKNSDTWRGEDFTFCWESRQKDIHVWCDVELSKEIGHIGEKAYYLHDTGVVAKPVTKKKTA